VEKTSLIGEQGFETRASKKRGELITHWREFIPGSLGEERGGSEETPKPWRGGQEDSTISEEQGKRGR